MPPPRRDEDDSDADLTAILAASEDRLLKAIRASLDLDAGLAQIIGNPPGRAAAARSDVPDFLSQAGDLPPGPAERPPETTAAAGKGSSPGYHLHLGSLSAIMAAIVTVAALAASIITAGVMSHREADARNEMVASTMRGVSAPTAPPVTPTPSVPPQATAKISASTPASIITTYVVKFPHDRAQLTDSARSFLISLAGQITELRASIDITGYAASGGNRSYNLTLASARAQAVRSLLVTRGVPFSGIIELGPATVSYGDVDVSDSMMPEGGVIVSLFP